MKTMLLRYLLLAALLAVPVRAAFVEVDPPSAGGGAPTDATYITQTSDATLSAEQALGALASGCLSVTTGTGVVASSGAACGSGTAPSDAQYWVGAANGTLSAEKDLSGFTALVLNTAGTPTGYAGATSCTNQFFTGLSGTGASTCTTSTLAGAQHANQGTTTTLLHGNAAGNPSWAAVVSADHNITTTTCGAGDFINAISSTVVGTCATPAGGASTWTSIGAATGASTTANANNTGIVLNWTNTTDSTVAWTFGETAASTNGTSTSGVPNQVLLKLATVAASTMSPLSVYSRGNHVFSVSPSITRLELAKGSVSSPSLGFVGDNSGTGQYSAGTGIFWSVGGISAGGFGFTFPGNSGFMVREAAAGRANLGYNDAGNVSTTGLYFLSGRVGIAFADSSPSADFLSGEFRTAYASADTVSYAHNIRKSRGTLGAPTVITTGDDLATISGYGYVGATNTYQEAAKILLDSGGTISDSATGIGGLIDLYTAIVGAEPALRMRVDNVGHVNYSGTAPTISACGAGGSVVGNDMSMFATIANDAVTTCVINFAQTWATNAPVCTANDDTTALALTVLTSTTQVTVGGVFTNGDHIQILCVGRV